MKKILLATILLFNLSAYAEEQQPFLLSVDKTVVGGRPLTEVKITSKLDLLVIQSVLVNKGNCKIATYDKGKLKFGENASFYFDCWSATPIQIDVKTDKGSWTFTPR